MATEERSKIGLLDVLGMVGFAIVVGCFLFVGIKAGTRMLGLSVVVVTLVQHLSGRGISYGWEGRPPSGYITGWLGTCLSILMALVGAGMVLWPEVAMGIAGWDK